MGCLIFYTNPSKDSESSFFVSESFGNLNRFSQFLLSTFEKKSERLKFCQLWGQEHPIPLWKNVPSSARAGVGGGGGEKSWNVPMERHISVCIKTRTKNYSILTTSKGISNYMINLQVH